MPKFEFVVSDGASKKRPTAALRSHAVKSGLQRKNQAEVRGGANDSQLTIRQKDSLKGRFRLSDENSTSKKGSKTANKQSKNKNSAKTLEPKPSGDNTRLHDEPFAVALPFHPSTPETQMQLFKSPAQGRDDPFGTFPVSLAGDLHSLVRFYISRFDLPVPIAAIQREWWEYAQTDTLLMHSTLGVSAAMWGAVTPLPPVVVKEGWRQKGMALRGVQERLDQGDGSMTLVGAIANLANLEGVEGNYHVARLHLKGLNQIVQTWPNGYNTIQSNVNVARTINWSDIQAAIGLGLRPLLPLVFSLDSIVLPLSILTAAEQPDLLHLQEFERDADDTTVQFSFSLTRQAILAAKHKEVPGGDFRILMNATDHFLADTLAKDDLSNLGRAFVTAAHITYYALVRQIPLRAPLPRILVRRLRKQLDTFMDEFRSSPKNRLGLIWALLIGAAASYESREGFEFFSSNLLMMLICENVHEPVELEAIARQFILHKNFPGSFLRQYGPSLFPPNTREA